MRISDWSSDVCSSDLDAGEKALIEHHVHELVHARRGRRTGGADDLFAHRIDGADIIDDAAPERDGQLLALREHVGDALVRGVAAGEHLAVEEDAVDRKSTRLNSSH